MPRGDRTGPAGTGSQTGRAAGFCAGYNTPGFQNPGVVRGAGLGAGRGGGFRRGLNRNFNSRVSQVAPDSDDFDLQQEIKMLKTQANSLTVILQEVNSRLATLEGEENGD